MPVVKDEEAVGQVQTPLLGESLVEPNKYGSSAAMTMAKSTDTRNDSSSKGSKHVRTKLDSSMGARYVHCCSQSPHFFLALSLHYSPTRFHLLYNLRTGQLHHVHSGSLRICLCHFQQ